MIVSEYISQFFSKKSIQHVFMVTGGGAMFLNDSLSRNKNFQVSCFHHEQACAMAAEAYFKVSNRPAIVNVTTGPGCTNAITGVYGAYVDSSAMIVISGQVKRPTMKRYHSEELRQLGDQEIDIVPVVKTITKYAVLLDKPQNIQYELEKAYHIATSGRPGPVWIDVPIDIQSMQIPKQTKKFVAKKTKLKVSATALKKINELLQTSQRPVIIAGTGVHMSGSKDLLTGIVESSDIPLVSSFCASDVLPSSHSHFIGRQGTIGDRAGNFAVQNADLVFVLGSRLNIRQVSYGWASFAKDAKIVMVDIDRTELMKPTLKIDIKVQADLKDFLVEFKKIIRKTPKKTPYLKWCQERKEKYPASLPDYRKSPQINPYTFIEELSKNTPEDTVIVTADGAAAITSFQSFATKKGQRLFSNSGSAPMGYDLPASIGAAIAHQKNVTCIAGDGSIMMNLQELQTIRTLNLPIAIFIINNGGYLSILQTQNNYFKDNIFGCGTGPELGFPEFKKIAAGFDLPYERIETIKDCSIISKLKLPCIVEVMVDPKQLFEPKLVSRRLADGTFASPVLDDMYPFLSEDEYKSNRITE